MMNRINQFLILLLIAVLALFLQTGHFLSLGGANPNQVKAFGGFATSIGVAFQIQDDILNIIPEHVEWGKEIGEDIKEGKRSLMVIHALSQIKPGQKNRLLGILNSKEKSDSDVAQAISIIKN